MTKITVIDAPCGAGKTSWAIQEMNRNKDRAYIYCTPFLDEVDRIRKACGYRRFDEPKPYNGTKIDNFNDLLAGGGSIAVTHTTFLNATQETLDRIFDGDYTLILDEALDVIMEFNSIKTVEDSPRQEMSPSDVQFLLNKGSIKIHPDYRVEWVDADYNHDFKYAEVERLAKLGMLYCYRKKLLVTVFPPKIFLLFDKVYVLTYIFGGCVLKYYFQQHGIECALASIYENDGNYSVGEYTTDSDHNFRRRLRELVTVCDSHTLNRPKRKLSMHWYDKANTEDFKQLRNDMGSYFNRYLSNASARNGDIMWTAPKKYAHRLRGKGFSMVRSLSKDELRLPEQELKNLKRTVDCFVSCNSKATNIYRNRWALAYCYDMHPNPMIWDSFSDFNDERVAKGLAPIIVDKREYAISCLIQWMCRSRIRDGKPISIYLPSDRMRKLFNDWVNV